LNYIVVVAVVVVVVDIDIDFDADTADTVHAVDSYSYCCVVNQ
jgi:hypothetical protein